MKNVIAGHIEDLPPQTPNTVRVYLSSNYKGKLINWPTKG